MPSIMKSIFSKIHRYGKIRKLHTITSQETIKPSSPTPPHLKIHNFPKNDVLAPDVHLPLIFFYQNYNMHGDINILKKSLSQCLTQYYPFAGRFLTPSHTSIECNDQGVEFFEASINSRLDEFMHKIEDRQAVDHLTPNNFLYAIDQNNSHNIVAVQLNHFTCGGAAVTVSLSHKIADGFTSANFINNWATLTRGGSPPNPTFFSSPTITKFKEVVFPSEKPIKIEYGMKKFVFPNAKLIELKNKIISMSTQPLNPSRVESLTSLIFKCATQASLTKSGSRGSSNFLHAVDLRTSMGPIFPKIAIGNLYTLAMVKMMDSDALKLHEVATSLRKEITELRRIRSVDEASKNIEKVSLEAMKDQFYKFTSAWRFPFYDVDFGWGKPVRVAIQNGFVDSIILMESPSKDGIEATMYVEKEVLDIFQKDKELLAYVEDI